MIASVVATLDNASGSFQRVIKEIAKLPNVDVGEVATDSLRIPIAIDSPDPNSLENMTRQLQGFRGIEFIDVVFVHFDDELESDGMPSYQGTDKR
ncbi:MAG: nitrate reductase NapAB chaperone NapD [Mariniblastus sp.]|jgi:nitrate reductase NapAB chaperone NapD